jgi:hypothetical protein
MKILIHVIIYLSVMHTKRLLNQHFFSDKGKNPQCKS